MTTHTNNRLLASLTDQSRELLLAHAVPVALTSRMVLAEAEITPTSAYFVTSGMVSVVTAMRDGDTAEVGVVGCEGLVGGIYLLGPGKVPTTSFVQLEGMALKVPLAELRKIFRSSEEVRDRILEFYQEQALTISQIAGCNRLHEAEERLARWLLMAQDRTQTDILDFTQEFLGMMLGSRRTTVTMIAASFQRIGLIEYSRGRVKILNRAQLELLACDCYRITRNLLTNLYAPVHGTVADATGLAIPR